MAMCGNCGVPNGPAAERCIQCQCPLTAAASGYRSGAPVAERAPTKRDVLITAADGKLFGLRVRDGMLVWWNQIGHAHEMVFSVQIHDDLVFALTSGGRLFCVEYATGRTRWTHPTKAGDPAAFEFVAGLLFVAYADTLDCLDTHGYRLWSQRIPGIGARAITVALPKPQA